MNREEVTVPLCVHFLWWSQAAAISQPGEQTRWQMGPPQTLTLPTPHMPHLSTQAGLGLHLSPASSCCIRIHHNNSWAHGVVIAYWPSGDICSPPNGEVQCPLLYSFSPSHIHPAFWHLYKQCHVICTLWVITWPVSAWNRQGGTFLHS